MKLFEITVLDRPGTSFAVRASSTIDAELKFRAKNGTQQTLWIAELCFVDDIAKIGPDLSSEENAC